MCQSKISGVDLGELLFWGLGGVAGMEDTFGGQKWVLWEESRGQNACR